MISTFVRLMQQKKFVPIFLILKEQKLLFKKLILILKLLTWHGVLMKMYLQLLEKISLSILPLMETKQNVKWVKLKEAEKQYLIRL